MRKRWSVPAVAGVILGVALLSGAVAWAKLRPGPPVMLSNLNHMQSIVKALALTDFAGVAEHAKAIKANAAVLKTVKVQDLDAGIPAAKQAEFVKYATALETEAGNLAAAAEGGQPGKALDAYKNMIGTGCFACHSKLRD